MEAAPQSPVLFTHYGYCPICAAPTRFSAERIWFRDYLRCERCGSIPRERALFAVVEMYYPHWRELPMHESSPGSRGASPKFAAESTSYVPTHFYPNLELGKSDSQGRVRNENLEAQTFPDESFDLVITQDVFEHLFHPDRAIAEIGRTLRPGGAHICTVPITRKAQPSVRRASIEGNEIVHHLEPQYHGNPISQDGSLVTVDWGYDITGYLAKHSGLEVTTVFIDDIDRGIRAEFIEVLVCRKPPLPASVL